VRAITRLIHGCKGLLSPVSTDDHGSRLKASLKELASVVDPRVSEQNIILKWKSLVSCGSCLTAAPSLA
jgi:hypothetical protein